MSITIEFNEKVKDSSDVSIDDLLSLVNEKVENKTNGFINLDNFMALEMEYNDNCSYHFYWILVQDRKKFRRQLSENGIETGTHYKPVHEMSMYKKKITLPITEKVGKKIVTLPIHPNLSFDDIDRIVRIANKFA